MELDGRMDMLRKYMLAETGAGVEFPFGPQAMVIKVAGKMFGLIDALLPQPGSNQGRGPSR